MKNILLFSLALLFIGGCSKSSNPAADENSSTENAISIENGAFSPSTFTISIGETIKWTLNASHTVDGDDFTPVAGSLATYSHQFDTAGEFGYKCSIHSSMTGSITVTE